MNLSFIKTLFLLVAVLMVTSCGEENAANSEVPQDLAGKKALLATKKSELQQLKADIETLQAEVDKLDPPKEKKRLLVTTQPIERKTFERFVEVQGTIQADNTFNVSSEVGGRLTQFSLKEGDMVRKGQLIAKVDMESVNKQIAEVEKSLELAVTTYQRQDRLWKQNIGSEMQYLQAKNSKERLEESLKTLRFQLTKANVYASASGKVNRKMVNAGDVISPGMPLIEILNLGRVKAVANVPETYIGTVRRGQRLTVKFPALEKEMTAPVSLIGDMIEPNNRTFKVEINLRNGGNLKPNLLATVMIKDLEEKNVIVLPDELIQQEVSGRSFVMVTKEGEEGLTADKIYVEQGESYNGESVITSGLEGSEQIIFEGARGLKNGDLVTVETK